MPCRSTTEHELDQSLPLRFEMSFNQSPVHQGQSSQGDVPFSTAIGDVVVASEERLEFPSRRALREASTRSLRDIERTLSRAPWWDIHAIGDRSLLAYYTDDNGMLPDGLPASIVESFDFTRRCLVPFDDLRTRNDGRDALFRHIRDVYARSARMPCGDPIPTSYGVDLYCYRTYGEVDYVDELVELDVTPWKGVFGVSQDALCFTRPQLRADFRYDSKSGSAYWAWVKWERRMQRNDGLLVAYHCVEYQNLRQPRRATRYPREPSRFDEVEMPTHCYVDPPPVLAYAGSKLMAPESGWWVVYHTERAAKIACFILWDVYDRHKLWHTPKRMIDWIRSLDLAWVLGSPVNQEDLHHLLDAIEATDWSTGEVIGTHSGGPDSRPAATDEHGTALECGEFIWYDPWERERIDARLSKERRRTYHWCGKPDGHPSGYRYNPPLPPIAVQRLRWAQCGVPSIPASHFYEEESGSMIYAGPPTNLRSGIMLESPSLSSAGFRQSRPGLLYRPNHGLLRHASPARLTGLVRCWFARIRRPMPRWPGCVIILTLYFASCSSHLDPRGRGWWWNLPFLIREWARRTVGGRQWLVPPGTPAWRTWQKRLRPLRKRGRSPMRDSRRSRPRTSRNIDVVVIDAP